MQAIEPWVVLLLLPVLIGLGSGMLSRDTRRASLVAVVACSAVVVAGVTIRVPEASWNWLAAFLVLPLPIAVTLAMVLLWHGRESRRRHAR